MSYDVCGVVWISYWCCDFCYLFGCLLGLLCFVVGVGIGVDCCVDYVVDDCVMGVGGDCMFLLVVVIGVGVCFWIGLCGDF